MTTDSDTAIVDGSQSRFVRFLKGSSWTIAAILLLLFFTLMKLPDDRIAPFLDAKIQEQLRPMGISYTSSRQRLKIGFGLSYILEDATIRMPHPTPPMHFEKVTISPAFLSLLTGKLGAGVDLVSGRGEANLDVKMGTSSQSVGFKLKKVSLADFGKVPGASDAPPQIDFMSPNPLAILMGLRKSGTVDGSGSFSGNLMIPNSLEGRAELNLSKFVIEQQTVVLQIPRIGISEGKIDLPIEKGKLVFKTVKLGKGPTDDLNLTMTGDMVLGKQWDTSIINAKVGFSLSESVKKALVLADAYLAQGKQADGSYSFSISGPLNGPPVAAGLGGGK